MTDEEQQIIKAMILENKKDVVVIKKIREYINLGVLQAKKVYEKIKRVYNYKLDNTLEAGDKIV
ncbi:hypothetical protein OQG76_08325 [Streptococcus macedonicus]|uniref:Uncharacterized protein n=2 Tax=Streptococcus macedonicus TaxID=59310 RepID=A0AA47FCP0_STRMC|nr:hypothetical protein [Streptococcus macedonicus]MCW8486738.1 hypothetical protein [Streptococcus macedonicus]MCW8494925.1 hypothetical protein [Streptococcus macedonicus]MCW8500223.1 hypothetical protein [Streptococcus macedonicus]MCW8502274.1 hypothetical protein [Streptococcus macedonicus]MCW8504350.1 hypothetical protein [Streptococcus macedonicus]